MVEDITTFGDIEIEKKNKFSCIKLQFFGIFKY